MFPITLPKSYNYIGVFLTLKCNYRCSYCINSFDGLRRNRTHLTGRQWVEALNRIEGHLPVTLQGGEPSLHPDFIYIINNLKPQLDIDILTNLQFDVDEFIASVDPDRIRRDAPYASIRVSYHPEVMELDGLLIDVCKLQDRGFSIGIWGVLHPQYVADVMRAKAKATELGIDFRTKEFLGIYEGKLYGTYLHTDACNAERMLSCECKTTELLIAPDGGVFPCHSSLYSGHNQIGNVLDRRFQIQDKYRPCHRFGRCNPCDVKVKTNRFQQFGHTSVSIRNIARRPRLAEKVPTPSPTGTPRVLK